MTDRIYAIANFDKEEFDFEQVYEALPFKENAELYFFTAFNKTAEIAENTKKFIKVFLFPPELVDSESKMRNFVTETFYSAKIKTFLHVVSDALPIKNEKLDLFVPAIEEMMRKFKQISWFSTRSDPCNYVFEKYNPKYKVEIDKPNSENYNRMVYFTAFANTAWTIFDYSVVSDLDMVKLNDSFRIPMFYIVEYLSRRRKYQTAFMNAYPTVDEERWVFDPSSMFVQKLEPEKEKFGREDYEKENKLFMEMKVDFEPLTNVEKIFEMICEKLNINPFEVPVEETETEKKEEKKND